MSFGETRATPGPSSHSTSPTYQYHPRPYSMIEYISGEKLAEIIKSGKVPLKVDVRDGDYAGGNIKGSRNVPSLTFSETIDELVNETKDVPMMIFHCSLSQQRGPTAAALYKRKREALRDEAAAQSNCVYVLRDGFKEFQGRYKHDPELVENWSANVWAPDWNWYS
ncbi:hypothetical protein BV22DRAFT_249376 [Leucogyrophana mollusca]|uniref:Uncharacterized protein n=1 Tax=Leucogyrophana mollusca TaxID=85980 RepID=A0ACB8BQ64_9AGAM|nr:hypothetical protein BV22DRAFT_249376 [Leucogyrophana mollusca]